MVHDVMQATLKRLMVVMESLESLERLLNIRRKSSSSSSSLAEERSEIEQLSERCVYICHNLHRHDICVHCAYIVRVFTCYKRGTSDI